jgi:hypothetical protein
MQKPYITFANPETGKPLTAAEADAAILNQEKLIDERSAGQLFTSYYIQRASTTERQDDIRRLMYLKTYRDYMRGVEFEASAKNLHDVSEALNEQGMQLATNLKSFEATMSAANAELMAAE